MQLNYCLAPRCEGSGSETTRIYGPGSALANASGKVWPGNCCDIYCIPAAVPPPHLAHQSRPGCWPTSKCANSTYQFAKAIVAANDLVMSRVKKQILIRKPCHTFPLEVTLSGEQPISIPCPHRHLHALNLKDAQIPNRRTG